VNSSDRAARERDAIADDPRSAGLSRHELHSDARLIVQGLTPLTDADGNLDAALDGLAQRSSLSATVVRFQATREAPVQIDLKTRNHLYRIAQEAVAECSQTFRRRHDPDRLQAREHSIRLEISDEGRGISPRIRGWRSGCEPCVSGPAQSAASSPSAGARAPATRSSASGQTTGRRGYLTVSDDE